jgi:ribonuclease R
LLVHRAIRHIVRSDIPSKQVVRVDGASVIHKKNIYPYDVARMLAFGEQCSMTERRADDATREVVAWLKCEYLQDRVGDSFAGVISAVTGFGLFVELVDVFVEGLVHVSSLASDYYHFDQVKQRLLGERTGTSFQLGDTVTVQVARVSLEDKKIDLEMVEGSSRAKRRSIKAKKNASPISKVAAQAEKKKKGGAKKAKASRKPSTKKKPIKATAKKAGTKKKPVVRKRK